MSDLVTWTGHAGCGRLVKLEHRFTTCESGWVATCGLVRSRLTDLNGSLTHWPFQDAVTAARLTMRRSDKPPTRINLAEPAEARNIYIISLVTVWFCMLHTPHTLRYILHRYTESFCTLRHLYLCFNIYSSLL